MGYQLPSHISFCREGGATILLDLRRDWYFQLDPSLEPAFESLVNGQAPPAPTEMLQRLVDLGVIQDVPGAETDIAATAISTPTQTWRDEAAPAPRAPWASALEVWLAIRRARTQVRKVGFERLIERLRARKAKRQAVGAYDPEALKTIAAGFNRARRAAPIDPICLQDSLALLEICARRNLFPELVIGVSLAPFQAHCWVQAGAMALNESLDRVRAFQPILVV